MPTVKQKAILVAYNIKLFCKCSTYFNTDYITASDIHGKKIIMIFTNARRFSTMLQYIEKYDACIQIRFIYEIISRNIQLIQKTIDVCYALYNLRFVGMATIPNLKSQYGIDVYRNPKSTNDVIFGIEPYECFRLIDGYAGFMRAFVLHTNKIYNAIYASKWTYIKEMTIFCDARPILRRILPLPIADEILWHL